MYNDSICLKKMNATLEQIYYRQFICVLIRTKPFINIPNNEGDGQKSSIKNLSCLNTLLNKTRTFTFNAFIPR